MREFTLHSDNQGRILLPSWWRKLQGIDTTTELHAVLNEEGGLVIETREQGLRRAQKLVRKYIPEEVNLSAEIISDHRSEAEREQRG